MIVCRGWLSPKLLLGSLVARPLVSFVVQSAAMMILLGFFAAPVSAQTSTDETLAAQRMMAAAKRIANAMRPRSDPRGIQITTRTRQDIYGLMAVHHAAVGDGLGGLELLIEGRTRNGAAEEPGTLLPDREGAYTDLSVLQEMVAILAASGSVAAARELIDAQATTALNAAAAEEQRSRSRIIDPAPDWSSGDPRVSWGLMTSLVSGLMTTMPEGAAIAAPRAQRIAQEIKDAAPANYLTAKRFIAQGLARIGDSAYGLELLSQREDSLLPSHLAIGILRGQFPDWKDRVSVIQQRVGARADLTESIAAELAMQGDLEAVWEWLDGTFASDTMGVTSNPRFARLMGWIALQTARRDGVLGLSNLLNRIPNAEETLRGEILRGFVSGLALSGQGQAALFILQDMIVPSLDRAEALRLVLLEGAIRGQYERLVPQVESMMIAAERRVLAADLLPTLVRTASPQYFLKLPLDTFSHAPVIDVLTRWHLDRGGKARTDADGGVSAPAFSTTSQTATAVARLAAAMVAISQISLSVP